MEVSIFLWILTIAVLTHGAIWDGAKRIIPNRVPIIILLLGIVEVLAIPSGEKFYTPIAERMEGALIPAIALLAIYHFDKRIGGGDFKLLIAMGFNLGIQGITPVLFITTITGILWSFITKQKSVPLAVFLTLGLYAYTFILWGGSLP